MGLDTSHDAWHGSYGSFYEWRVAIATAAGFPPLKEMYGFGGDRVWEASPGDPRLVPLLHHSDCDGKISPADCAAIAAYLDERRKQGWVEIEIGNGEPDWTMADHFAASLDRGIAAERESCAKIVEDAGSLTSESNLAEAAADAFNAGSARRTAAERICAYSAVVAAAIRARGNPAQGER